MIFFPVEYFNVETGIFKPQINMTFEAEMLNLLERQNLQSFNSLANEVQKSSIQKLNC